MAVRGRENQKDKIQRWDDRSGRPGSNSDVYVAEEAASSVRMHSWWAGSHGRLRTRRARQAGADLRASLLSWLMARGRCHRRLGGWGPQRTLLSASLLRVLQSVMLALVQWLPLACRLQCERAGQQLGSLGAAGVRLSIMAALGVSGHVCIGCRRAVWCAGARVCR